MAINILKKFSVLTIAFFLIFTLVPSVIATSCVNVTDCPGQGKILPIGVAEYVVYDCIDGVCTASEPVQVECLSNLACQEGYECDISQKECVLKEVEAETECECEPCEPCPETQDYTNPIIIAGALIALAIVFSVIYKKRK
ncbi:hypothetical protein GF374_01350 [Candidatus Woesearchaeota archaeon]|nr:hypothetical protein [Candidatus Woesearchaeota archaeon]